MTRSPLPAALSRRRTETCPGAHAERPRRDGATGAPRAASFTLTAALRERRPRLTRTLRRPSEYDTGRRGTPISHGGQSAVTLDVRTSPDNALSRSTPAPHETSPRSPTEGRRSEPAPPGSASRGTCSTAWTRSSLRHREARHVGNRHRSLGGAARPRGHRGALIGVEPRGRGRRGDAQIHTQPLTRVRAQDDLGAKLHQHALNTRATAVCPKERPPGTSGACVDSRRERPRADGPAGTAPLPRPSRRLRPARRRSPPWRATCSACSARPGTRRSRSTFRARARSFAGRRAGARGRDACRPRGHAARRRRPERRARAGPGGTSTELAELGGGRPLPDDVRTMEPRFGTDFGTSACTPGGSRARSSSALGADAFTYGKDVYYGAGRAPGVDPLTAHELAHVVQQRGAGVQRQAHPAELHGQLSGRRRHLRDRLADPAGRAHTPTTHIGFDGYMRFFPNVGTPNSNNIVIIQIVKLTDLGGKDVNPGTMPADAGRARRARTGPACAPRTTRRAASRAASSPTPRTSRQRPGGTRLGALARLRLQPAAPGTTGVAGKVAAARHPRRRHRRRRSCRIPASSAPTRRRTCSSTSMYDTPGTTDPAADLNFDFETVVRGVDTQYTYAAVKWGFEIVDGVVKNEYLNIQDTASATFAEAMDRHQDFYVHEPMTFYFDFDKPDVTDIEAAKIDGLLPYLTRNPKAKMSLEGEADVRGGASKHNTDLAAQPRRERQGGDDRQGRRRGPLRRGHRRRRRPPPTRPPTPARATMGGDPAVGADQDREANRWANRRVVLTFLPTPLRGLKPADERRLPGRRLGDGKFKRRKKALGRSSSRTRLGAARRALDAGRARSAPRRAQGLVRDRRPRDRRPAGRGHGRRAERGAGLRWSDLPGSRSARRRRAGCRRSTSFRTRCTTRTRRPSMRSRRSANRPSPRSSGSSTPTTRTPAAARRSS